MRVSSEWDMKDAQVRSTARQPTSRSYILARGDEAQNDETRKTPEGVSDPRSLLGGLGVLRRTHRRRSAVPLDSHHARCSRHRRARGIRFNIVFLPPEVRLYEPHSNRSCVSWRCGGIGSLLGGASIREELRNVLQCAGNLDTFRSDIRSNLPDGPMDFVQFTSADSEQIG
jgi:hypothetical protein